MKKKLFPIAAAFLFLTAAVAWLVFHSAAGRRPFQHIAPGDIAAASVTVSPPDRTAALDAPAIQELAGILRVLTIYRRDGSYHDYCGQAVTFTVTLRDGSAFTVQAYNPFLVLDGEGYRTSYEPCQALSALGNKLVGE